MRNLASSLLLLGCVCAASGTPHPLQVPDVDWTPRLLQLDPSRPTEYFELAEEVADASDDPSDVQLALQLFALAGQLDFERLGYSSILAIRHHTTDPDKQAYLRVAADLLSNQELFVPPVGSSASVLDEDRMEFGRMLAAWRMGRQSEVAKLIQAPGVRSLVGRYAEVLGRDPLTLAAQLDTRLPSLDRRQLRRQLLLEWAVLDREGLNWSAELSFSGGAPLQIIDLIDFQELLGIDVERPYWSSGEWRSRPESPSEVRPGGRPGA